MYYNSSIKNQNSPPKIVLIALIITIAVLFVTIIVFAILATIKPRQKVVPLSAAPSAFTHFVADAKTFSCLSPNGWYVTTQSENQTGQAPFIGDVKNQEDLVTFEDGDAKMVIVTDDLASIFWSGMSLFPDKMKNDPRYQNSFDVKDESDGDSQQLQKSVPNYKEGASTPFTCPFGQGIVVGFTGGHDLHGMVATVMGPNKLHIKAICLCDERNWPQARPVFMHVIDSLGPGS